MNPCNPKERFSGNCAGSQAHRSDPTAPGGKARARELRAGEDMWFFTVPFWVYFPGAGGHSTKLRLPTRRDRAPGAAGQRQQSRGDRSLQGDGNKRFGIV